MKIPASWTRIVAVGTVFAALGVGIAVPQQKGTGQVPTATTPDPFGQTPDGKAKPGDQPSPFGASEEKQAKLRNEDRQKRLIADTDKLLQLATELHNDVGKTDQHILSLDVVKRADEIERLAHSVKERM
jgi:hypothetical protein